MKPLIVPVFIPNYGCPAQCVYCNQRSVTGGEGTLPAADDILATIAQYRATGKRESVEVAFYGGSFTNLSLSMQDRLLTPLQPELADGRISAIRVSARPDAIDESIVGFLKMKGVSIVELGIQSMCDEVLEAAGRGHSAAHSVSAIAILKGAGLKVGAQLMPGLPGDTETRSIETMQITLALSPDFIRIYPTVVLAGTELAKRYKAGAYMPHKLDEAVTLCKKLLHLALQRQAPVIRIGLQPTSELSSPGTVLAGPYHPAFRQLVEGELFADLIAKMTVNVPVGAEIKLECAPARISDLAGQGRRNIRLLHSRRLKVKAILSDATLADRQVRVTVGENSQLGDILHDLSYV